MAARLDPSKAKEAGEELDKGNKAVKTSAFKWKADHLSAEPHFKNAGRLFKSAGMYDSALEAYRKAVHSSLQMDNLKQAALTLENVAREWSMIPGNGNKQVAGDMFNEAANHLLDAGELARASDLKVKAAKQLEGINKDKANKILEEAAAVFDGDTDKDVYAVQPLQLVLREQLALGKHASATRTLDKLLKIYTRLKQPHNIFKALLSRVILLLAAADPVSAQHEYEKALDLDGFAASNEAGAAEDMISCYTEMNADALKSVVNRSAINFLDAPIARIAKGLPDALLSGAQVGVSHPDEAATRAVAPTKRREFAGLEGFREFGEGGGSTAAAAAAGSDWPRGESDPAEAEAAARAKRDASRTAGVRSALFSRPTGGKAAPPPEEEEEEGVYSSGGRGAKGRAGDRGQHEEEEEEDDLGPAFAAGASIGGRQPPTAAVDSVRGQSSGRGEKAAAARPAPARDYRDEDDDEGYAAHEQPPQQQGAQDEDDLGLL